MPDPSPNTRLRWSSPLGDLLLQASACGLQGVWLAHLAPPTLGASGNSKHGSALLQNAKAQLEAYFTGSRRSFDLALDLSLGTAFQQTVWQALLSLGWGQSCSYAELAHRIGKPGAARAVGQALGRNPLIIVVPCHRVLAAGRRLGGYSCGLACKMALLRLEGVTGFKP